jgi:transmembrane sensor
MSTISVQGLFKKYLDDNINPEEFAQLCEFIGREKDPAALEELLEDSLSNPVYAAKGRDYDLKKVFSSLLIRIGQRGDMEKTSPAEEAVPEKWIPENGAAPASTAAPVIPMRRKTYRGYWIAAAACLLFLILARTTLWEKPVMKPIIAKVTPVVKNDVSPGHEGAILTLANGQEIVLDSARSGSLATQGTTKITKLSSGQLDYTSLNGKPTEVLYNTLTTPRARTTTVILADGTEVWLNAASSIKYPTAFAGKERSVEISGEVYFEVAKNAAMPFVVKRAHSDEVIQVLGTNFNVNAYDDEDNMKTTLLEGSVKVIKGRNSRLLSPGQQAIFGNGSDDLQVIDDANTDEVMAWKNGRFQFSNMDLKTIMRQLMRWYDIDVVFEGAAPDIRIGGFIHKDVYLSTVMEFLGENGVRYKMEEKKIIILR